MNNTEILQNIFGDDVIYLECIGRSSFGFDKRTGKITYHSHSFPLKLVHQVFRAHRYEVIDENTIVYEKDSSYTVYAPKAKGRHNYTTTTTVKRVDGEIKCEIHSGLTQIIANAYLDDPINEAVKARAEEMNDTGKFIENFVAHTFMTYELDEPDFSWDGYDTEFEVELLENGLAEVNINITKDGEPADVDLMRITWFPTDSNTGGQIGDAWFGDLNAVLCNDFRIRGHNHLTSDGIHMKAILQRRDEDGDYYNRTVERDLVELKGHFTDFDYFKSNK